MKKKKVITILVSLAAALSALPMQASAAGNLSCNTVSAQGNSEALNVKVLWGQGPHGSDLTLISSNSNQMKFFSGYTPTVSPTVSNAGQITYHAQLLTLGTGQAFGEMFIGENQGPQGSTNGKFVLTQNGVNQSYGLNCSETGDVNPDPTPSPCFHSRACF